MKVTKTLRRICVLALLAFAFMFVGERAGVNAQSQDACGCLDDRDDCYSEAQNSRYQCEQSASSSYDSCVSNAYQSQDSCSQTCYYDYYYNGGGGDPNECYYACSEAASEEVSFCGEMYNSDLASCSSEEYSAERSCDDEYNYCIVHCPI
jgi:hypothetical protein